MKQRHKIATAVYLIVKKEDAILCVRRAGTSFMNGHFSLPAGHVDKNESVITAAIREAKEEINLELKPEDLRHRLTMHRKSPDQEYVDIYFEVLRYTDTICNKEPHKCSELAFFSPLPEKTIPYVHHALECLDNNITYTELGWIPDIL